jgi:long-chain fatty acid transport protein
VKYSLRLGPALALLSLASTAHAGGFGIPEYGVRRTGMAAIIGRPDEPAAVFQNPAGLTLLPGLRIYVGLGIAAVSTEFKLRPWERSEEFIDDPVDGEGYYPAVAPTRALAAIPMIVVTKDLWKGRLFGGASLYVSNATGAQFDDESVARYHLIDGYVVGPQLSLTLAYKVNEKVSVGGSVGVMHLRVHGNRYFFPVLPNGTDVSPLFGDEPELTLDGSDTKPVWNLGVYANPIPKLTLGAAVIGKVNATLEGDVKLVPSEDAGDPSERRGYQLTSQILPWTFHAGANYDVTPNLEVGADFRYYLYRQYKEQYTELRGDLPLQELRTPKNYNDSIQVSGGVRVHDLQALRGTELMLGTHYDKTPAPAQTVTFDQPTFSHWGLHSGVRHSVGRWRLAATYVRYWYKIPTTEDSITSPPSNVKGDGVNNIFSLNAEVQL